MRQCGVSFGLKYSVEDLGIAGNIPAFNFALVTPPFDSIKFGASVVSPTARTQEQGSKQLCRRMPNFSTKFDAVKGRRPPASQPVAGIGLLRACNLRLKARNKGCGPADCGLGSTCSARNPRLKSGTKGSGLQSAVHVLFQAVFSKAVKVYPMSRTRFEILADFYSCKNV